MTRIPSDEEIRSLDDDVLAFRPYAETLADLALTADTPFTVGIYGPWGTGKTSLLRLTRQLVAEQGAVAVWFDAWMHERAPDLRVDLVQAITLAMEASQAGAEGGNLAADEGFSKNLRKRLGRFFAGIEIDWTAVLNYLLSSLPGIALATVGLPLPGPAGVLRMSSKDGSAPEQTRTSAEYREIFEAAIAAFLESTGKSRIVVFIDDLDRCAPNMVAVILEAIRLFLGTDKTVFLVALDQRYALRAIRAHFGELLATEDEAVAFLEKVIQLEFPVPHLLPGRVEGFLEQFLPGMELIPHRSIIAWTGDNPRRLKRVVIGFQTLRYLARHKMDVSQLDELVLAKLLVMRSRWRLVYEALAAPRPRILEQTTLLRYLKVEMDRAAARNVVVGSRNGTTALAGAEDEGTSLGIRGLDRFLPFAQSLTSYTLVAETVKADADLREFIDEEPSLWEEDLDAHIALVGPTRRNDVEATIQSPATSEVNIESLLRETYALKAPDRSRAIDAIAAAKTLISASRHTAVVDRLLELGRDKKQAVRNATAFALSEMVDIIPPERGTDVVNRMLELTRDPDKEVRRNATHSLGSLERIIPPEGGTDVVNRMLELTREGDTSFQAVDAITRLSRLLDANTKAVLDARLKEMSQEPDSTLRASSAVGLHNLTAEGQKGEFAVQEVKEAPQSDVGLGRIRISTSTRMSLGVEVGDSVEIVGPRTTVARVFRLQATEDGKGFARCDGLVRRNCGIKVGDRVALRKAQPANATKIRVAPVISEGHKISFGEGIENFVRRGLTKRVMTQGDVFVIPGIALMGGALPFLLAKTEPSGVVKVTEETSVEMSEEPVSEAQVVG